MKAVAWSEPHTVIVEERPEPETGKGEVLVRIAACGICGTDLHLYSGAFTAVKGLSPGHEMTGIIEAGEGFTPGTAVAIDPMLSCLQCADCRNAQSSICQKSKLLGISAHGGMQQLMAVPAANCIALPDGFDPVLGSLAEPLAVAVRGVHRGAAYMPMGSRVLILGAGTIGLMCAMLLRDRVGEVAITARYPHQREAALKVGASAVFEPESADLKAWGRARRPDVVVETVGGSAATLTEAFKVVRAGGTILALGVFTGYTQINGFRLVNEEVNIIGSVMYGRAGSRGDYAVAVSELARYKSDLGVFQTAKFALADASAAFERAADKTQGTLKVTVLPNG